MAGMEELVDKPADGPFPGSNRGWFRKGDGRINREGRPKGSTKAGPKDQADRAPVADRLKLLVLPAGDIVQRLTCEYGPWIVSLPDDIEIVGCRMDSGRAAVVFVIRSEKFPRIARGAAIPEVEPYFNGLKWRRRT